MTCGKQCFTDQGAAEIEARRLANFLPRPPQGVYRCNPCEAWHITSWPQRDGKGVEPEAVAVRRMAES